MGAAKPHQHWHFARRSVSRNRPSLPPGGHIFNPHTPHPKPTMFPLHSQRCGGEARFPLRHQARQAHAVDAQGRVQVRSVRLRVRREGEGRPQGYSGGVERQNQTRHFSREDRGVGVQSLRPFYSPSQRSEVHLGCLCVMLSIYSAGCHPPTGVRWNYPPSGQQNSRTSTPSLLSRTYL